MLKTFHSCRLTFQLEIEDETSIDIGHEALIRCWTKVADPQTGWLRREFSDGLVWKTLVLGATAFESDRRQMLPAVTAAQRNKWLGERPALWSERYGGNWEAVKNFIETSDKRGKRGDRWRTAGKLVLVWIGLSLAVTAGADGIKNVFGDWATSGLLHGILAAVYGFAILVLLLQIAFDYFRQFFDWLLRRGASSELVGGIQKAIAGGLVVLLVSGLANILSEFFEWSLPKIFDGWGLLFYAVAAFAILYSRQMFGWPHPKRETSDPALAGKD